MQLMEASFDASTFSKNCRPWLRRALGPQVFDEVVAMAHERGLLSG